MTQRGVTNVVVDASSIEVNRRAKHVKSDPVDAGKLLDIEVLDHLVIGRNRYVSLKERGLGFR